MSVIRVAGRVKVDQCEGCGATWYDKGELRRVRRLTGLRHEKESTLRRRSREASGAPLVCPSCDKTSLVKRTVGLTPLAVCDDCKGILLPKQNLVRRRGLMRVFGPPPDDWPMAMGVLIVLILIGLLSLISGG
jgi:Zn-finger nucleic acid-binding protein